MEETKAKKDLRSAINAFCRWRVNHEECNPDDCEFCPVNHAYIMTREEDENQED